MMDSPHPGEAHYNLQTALLEPESLKAGLSQGQWQSC